MTRTWRTLTVFILMLTLGGLSAAAQGAQTPVRLGSPQAPTGAVAQTPQTAPQTPPPGTALQDPLVDRYIVGQARPPIVPGSELIELTLEQAYALALEKNLDLKVARMNPIINDYSLQTMRGAYRPNFNASYSYRNSLTPSNNVQEGVESLTNLSQSYNTGVTQLIKWYGAPNVSVSFSNGRTSTNNILTRVNPSFTTGLGFSGSMNLLNGFKIDNTRNQWRTYPIQREIVDIQLLNTIETTKNSVRTSYWQLRQAIEQIEIARRALELAKKSYADSLIRVEIGTAAQIDTITFDTNVTSAEGSLLQAEISWQQAELNFKRLLVTGTDDELYRKTINPTDRPTLSVQSVDIQSAVTKTLAQGTNLIIARKNVDVSRLNLQVTKGALLPSLSMNGGYNASGQGGTQHITVDGVPVIIQGGYGDALGVLGAYPTWNIGFNVTYRFGQLNEKAAYATAVIRIDQALAQLKAQELQVSTAVTSAGLAVANSYKVYQAAVKTREAQERQTDAAQIRFDNGLLTNFEVVQQQNNLTNARLSELTRLIAYINAIAEFERVQKIGG